MADEEKGISLEDSHLNQPPSQEGSHFGDSSDLLFSMYSNIAEKDDHAVAERWQKDADGIIIFAGLFSAVIATFLSLSIPDLRPISQDTSTFYLKNIYQHLIDPNVSAPSTSPTAAMPPTYSPPRYAITVNLLWVFSLCMNLVCGVGAIMLQQWARQYVKFTRPPRRSPRRRARTRALFAGSVDRLTIRTMSFLLPCYLHIAGLFFFIGLLVFFLNINNTIFIHGLWFFVLGITVYTYFSVLPLFQSDSLIYTPASTFPASFVALLTCLVHSTFADRFKFKTWSVFEWLFEDVSDTVESISTERSPEIDLQILESTLNSLNELEDDTMENFFRAIPDFFNSKWVKLHPTNLPPGLQDVFKEASYEFLDCSFQSATVAESVKNSRLIICLDASRAALGPNGPSWILCNILNGNWPRLLRSVEMGHFLKSWVHGNDEENVLYIQSIVSHIVASAEKWNDRWLALVADQPGMSEDLLRHYLTHGDSVLLANLINIARLTFRSYLPNRKFHALPSKCDVLSTLPSLQHDFCSLWNEIVLEAQISNIPTPILILKNIHPIHVAIHSGTDASPAPPSATTNDKTNDDNNLDWPSSFPLCNIASHSSDESDLTPHDDNGKVEDVSPAIQSCVQSVPHHSPVLVSRIRPFDMPAYYSIRNPAGELSFGSVSNARHAPQPYTPVIPSSLFDSHPVPSFDLPLNVAAVGARQGSTDISAPDFIADLDLDPDFISSDEVASQQSKSVIPPSGIINAARPAVLPLSADSDPVVTQTCYLPYAQGFASLSQPTGCQHISPQVRSDLEAHITTGIRTLHEHDDTLDLNVPNSMRALRHTGIPASSTPDMASNTLRLGDIQQGLNQSRPCLSDG